MQVASATSLRFSLPKPVPRDYKTLVRFSPRWPSAGRSCLRFTGGLSSAIVVSYWCAIASLEIRGSPPGGAAASSAITDWQIFVWWYMQYRVLLSRTAVLVPRCQAITLSGYGRDRFPPVTLIYSDFARGRYHFGGMLTKIFPSGTSSSRCWRHEAARICSARRIDPGIAAQRWHM